MNNRPLYGASFLRMLRASVLPAVLLLGGFTGSIRAQNNPKPTQTAPNVPVHAFTLPFTPLKGHGGPVVRVRLNNQVDANFLLDTGSTSLVISSEIAKTLRLPIRHQAAPPGSTSITPGSQIDFVSLNSVNIAGIDAKGDSVVWDTLLEIAHEKIDGILGANFLRLFALVFDFERNQIFLLPGGKVTDAQLRSFGIEGGGAEGIPIKGTTPEDLLFTVPVSVGEKVVFPALIDTGMPQTFVLDMSKQLSVPTGSSALEKIGQTIEGIYKVSVIPFPSFGVGATSSVARRNNLSPFAGGVARETPIKKSVLGLDYLSHFHVVLDYPAQRLYLTPIANPQRLRFPTESSRQSAQEQIEDLKLIPSADGKWRVVSTQKEAIFGKAGLQAGDVLEKINGESPDGKLFYEVLTLLQKKEDSASFQLLRNSTTVTLEVKR